MLHFLTGEVNGEPVLEVESLMDATKAIKQQILDCKNGERSWALLQEVYHKRHDQELYGHEIPSE